MFFCQKGKMKPTNCEACKGTGAGERPEPVCKACDGRGWRCTPYPVHVVAAAGVQFIGMLQSERFEGNQWLVTLEPAYIYGIEQVSKEVVKRRTQLPWTFESSESVETVAVIVTALRNGSPEYEDLARDAERTRTEQRAQNSGIALTGQLPGRPSA